MSNQTLTARSEFKNSFAFGPECYVLATASGRGVLFVCSVSSHAKGSAEFTQLGICDTVSDAQACATRNGWWETRPVGRAKQTKNHLGQRCFREAK